MVKEYYKYMNKSQEYDPNQIQLCITDNLEPALQAGHKDWVLMQDGIFVIRQIEGMTKLQLWKIIPAINTCNSDPYAPL